MAKVRTVQVSDKLFILDGVGPLRYVDLTNNVVHQYPKSKRSFSFRYKVSAKKGPSNG